MKMENDDGRVNFHEYKNGMQWNVNGMQKFQMEFDF